VHQRRLWPCACWGFARTEFGVKGIGEGGAIAPPAAIANAVNDALKSLEAELLQSPITPARVLEAIDAVRLRADVEAAVCRNRKMIEG
jgi:hypothetical protein